MIHRLASLVLLISSTAFGQQKILSGTVSGSDGEPLPGVTVKLFSGGRLKTFARTNSVGQYLLKVPEGDSLRMSFERLSYAKYECPLPEKSPFDVIMTVAATELREVVVSAPSVKLRGDTLSFNMGAFMGKGDVSLEDALKKIPGITVESSGAIKYMGQDISNFYIEGLEMLGGHYSLATRNLPADYVSTVEVLSNHKERKMDAGKHSDDVAINIKLKSSVKIRPVGTYEGALGYVANDMLYRLSGTAMLFRPKLQTLVSVKGGNIRGFASSDMTLHYGSETSVGRAEKVLPPPGRGGAPVSPSRYENVRDWLVSANTVLKVSGDATVNVNASYMSAHNDFYYKTVTNYFTGEESLAIEEIVAPSSSSSKPSLDIDYTVNNDNRYVRNTLKASGEISHQELSVMNNGVPLDQKRRFRSVNLSDNFRYSAKIGSKEWNFETAVIFNNSPFTRLKVSSPGSSDVFGTQNVKTSAFKFSQSAYVSWFWGRHSLNLPISAMYLYDDIFTDMERSAVSDTNRVYANTGGIGISPSYRYEIPGNKFTMRVGIPVVFNIIRGENKITEGRMNVDKPTYSPNIYLFYKLNGNSEFTMNSGYSYAIGDILSLLGNPVQTSFRNFTARSGIMATSRGWNATLGYNFQQPFSYWFLRSNVSYSSTRRNTVGSSYITEGETYQTEILSPNTTDMASFNIDLSKTLNGIRSKVDVTTSGSWSKRETIQQGIGVRYYGRGLYGRVSFDCAPVHWLSFKWTPGISYSVSSYLGQSSSYTDFSENFRLMFFPGGGVQIKGDVEHVRTPIGEGSYKNIVLLDCSVVWKHGKWRWTLSLDNILNRKHYRYTVFSGLDTRHVDYTLKGRSAVASVAFTL